MRLKQLEAFNAVMLTGTVSGAARLLYVSQPAVTQTLQHAELQLGYPLFVRQHNRLIPTPQALALYPEVQRAMSQLEVVRRMASALGQEAQPFRIIMVPSLAVQALPDALRLWRQQHPERPIKIRLLHSREVLSAIALQEADIGIIYGALSHPALVQHRISTGRLVCVSRASAASPKPAATALKHILSEPFICIDDHDPIGAMLADQCARLGMQPSAGITVQTHHIALQLVLKGFGPAIVDSFTASIAVTPELDVQVITPEIPVEVSAVHSSSVALKREVQDFIEAFHHASQCGAV